ncbi:MAG: hypothetical protein FJ290_01020 [Planctomycetes bacterium]|nr:hypothetical protein [Planctomycetota bacterium]
MMVVRLPSEQGGDWWVVVHDLLLAEGRLRKLRPIHVLTHLAQAIVGQEKTQIHSYCMALENKLAAVMFHHLELRKTIAAAGDPVYVGRYVRPYDPDQRVVAALEAYLNSIYSALEIAAHINRLMNPGLPIGFMAQVRKYPVFNRSKWPWLGHFNDLRTQLTHFGTCMPTVSDQNLTVEFTVEKRLCHFARGRYQIPLAVVLHYCVELFALLDSWALEHLERVPPDFALKCIRETGIASRPKVEDCTAKEILGLLRGPETGDGDHLPPQSGDHDAQEQAPRK